MEERTKPMKAFCMKCRRETEIKEAIMVNMKNGNHGTQGVCASCGTKVFRVGKQYDQGPAAF